MKQVKQKQVQAGPHQARICRTRLVPVPFTASQPRRPTPGQPPGRGVTRKDERARHACNTFITACNSPHCTALPATAPAFLPDPLALPPLPDDASSSPCLPHRTSCGAWMTSQMEANALLHGGEKEVFSQGRKPHTVEGTFCSAMCHTCRGATTCNRGVEVHQGVNYNIDAPCGLAGAVAVVPGTSYVSTLVETRAIALPSHNSKTLASAIEHSRRSCEVHPSTAQYVPPGTLPTL